MRIVHPPFQHKAQLYIAWDDDKHKFTAETIDDKELKSTEADTRVEAYDKMAQYLDAKYPGILLHVCSSYDHFMQSVRNKLMHTINGNRTFKNQVERRDRRILLGIPSVLIATEPHTLDHTRTVPIGPTRTDTSMGVPVIDSTVFTLTAPAGTVVDLHIGGKVNNPTNVPSSGTLSASVNGNTTTVADVESSGNAESVSAGGTISFVSEVENIVDVIWHDLGGLATWFEGMLSATASDLTSVLPALPFFFVEYTFVSDAFVTTLSPIPRQGSKHNDVIVWTRSVCSAMRVEPIFSYVSGFDKWTQRHHNRMMHATNGNVDNLDSLFSKGGPPKKRNCIPPSTVQNA
jgi:hypothetical protein